MIERDEVFRIKTQRRPGTLAQVLAAIAEFDAHIGEIATLSIGPDYNIREVTVIAPGDVPTERITDAIASVVGVELMADPVDRVFDAHRDGKLKVAPNVEVRNLQHIREVYTPGVARVTEAIRQDPSRARDLTWRGRTIAVVTDGSRVLGLGDVGPLAALPVMEGKALFYAMFTDVNAIPICLSTTHPDEIVETVMRLAPSFGGIHLEDIASPGVYRVEEELDRRLDIPVFHDDQHGTAVVVLAAVLNALRRTGRAVEETTFGQVGLGAAGSAIARLATAFPFRSLRAFDPTLDAVERLESLHEGDIPLAATSAADGMRSVIAAADVLVLTTGRPNLVDPAWITDGQIVLALSNPVPEISRDTAVAAGAAIATDGAIVNNMLAFPGIFRGALDAAAPAITFEMKRVAAETLAGLAPEGELLPDPLDVTVHLEIARAVARAAG